VVATTRLKWSRPPAWSGHDHMGQVVTTTCARWSRPLAPGGHDHL